MVYVGRCRGVPYSFVWPSALSGFIAIVHFLGISTGDRYSILDSVVVLLHLLHVHCQTRSACSSILGVNSPCNLRRRDICGGGRLSDKCWQTWEQTSSNQADP